MHTHGGGFLPHLEGPGSTEAERGDDRVFPQRRLIVAVPVHAVLLISVEVAEKGVEGVAGELFDALLQHGQQRMPLQPAQHQQHQYDEHRPAAQRHRGKPVRNIHCILITVNVKSNKCLWKTPAALLVPLRKGLSRGFDSDTAAFQGFTEPALSSSRPLAKALPSPLPRAAPRSPARLTGLSCSAHCKLTARRSAAECFEEHTKRSQGDVGQQFCPLHKH